MLIRREGHLAVGDSTSAEVPMIEEVHRRFSMSLQCEMEQCEMEQREGFSTCAAPEPARGGSFSISAARSAAAIAAGVAAVAASAAAAAVSGAECAIKVAIHEASSPVGLWPLLHVCGCGVQEGWIQVVEDGAARWCVHGHGSQGTYQV